MQHKHAPQHQIQQHQQQTPTSKVQHLPQQQIAKLQTIISKPGQVAAPKPVQVPLKQAGQPVPVKAEAVQPPQKLPVVPPRKPSLPSSTSPPASEPPKVKPPQLTEGGVKRTQSVISRGAPPPLPPRRSDSVQYQTIPTQQQTRPVRRQSTINSAMPSCTPQPPPEFYIPQRRGSITRQQSSSSTTSASSSKLSK